MIGIRDVAGYLPPTAVRNQDIAAKLGFNADFLENKVGVETRRISAPGESTSDLCVHAFAALKQRNPQEDFSGVGLILLCTQNPDYKLPHTSSVLQARLELPSRVLTFDISLGCSGYVASLVTAKALMNEIGAQQALLFTCDPYSKVLGEADKSTVPLFSDAASVTLLEEGAPLAIGKGSFGNDGSRYETLIIRGSGTARASGETEQPLQMDGRNIFAMLKEKVPINVRACAEINGLTLDQVQLFLFHQASAWLLSVLLRDLALPAEKVPSNLRNVGNTVSSSIPLLLADLLAADQPPATPMLLSGFGVGLSWGSVVLTRQS